MGALTKILIIDDDPLAIRVLSSALADYGVVRFATDGTTGLRLAREAPPDLILLDAEMPGGDGFQVCRNIKNDPLLADVPVIFVTAHDSVAFEAEALAAGAADFLAKPVSPTRVHLRVRLHLQLKSQLDALRALATVDPLTGIGNRRAFDQRLEQEWHRAERARYPLSLVLVDVDQFKLYNDRYGHPQGDVCLKAVAEVVRSCSRRPGDLACRIGGEEFAVVMPETTHRGAFGVAESMRARMQDLQLPHAGSAGPRCVTLSIGVVCQSPTRDATALELGTGVFASTAALLAAADQALYEAKQHGRNRVESFRPAPFPSARP